MDEIIARMEKDLEELTKDFAKKLQNTWANETEVTLLCVCYAA
jgi:hypothetical protein